MLPLEKARSAADSHVVDVEVRGAAGGRLGRAADRLRRFADRYDVLTAQSVVLGVVAGCTVAVLTQLPGVFRPTRLLQVQLAVVVLLAFTAYFAVVARTGRVGLWIWCSVALLAITAVGTASSLPGVTMCCLLATSAVAVSAAMMLSRSEVLMISLLCIAALGATLVGATGWMPRTTPLLIAAGGVIACSPGQVVLAYRQRLERVADEAQRLAVEDQLTGVLNRRGLAVAVDSLVAAAVRRKGYVAVLVLDVDHFKAVNDRFGHALGDDVLRGVATALARVARAQDLLARLGGEEFCLVAHLDDAGELPGLAERLRLAVAGHEMEPRVTISVGATGSRPRSETSPESLMTDLIRRADDLMYQAKDGGRNTVRVLTD